MSNSQLTARYGRNLADAVGAALVYEMHDDEGALLRSIHRPETEWRRAGHTQAEAVAAADGVIALSPEDAQIARTMTSAPVHVVPCGAEPGGPSLAKSGGRAMAFIGNLYYEPNRRAIDYLRGAQFTDLLEHLDASVDVFGRYPADLRDGEASETVRLRGPVPHLREAIASAAVGLAPLDSGGGMELKVLAYMAAGIPLVGTGVAATGFEQFDSSGSSVGTIWPTSQVTSSDCSRITTCAVGWAARVDDSPGRSTHGLAWQGSTARRIWTSAKNGSPPQPHPTSVSPPVRASLLASGVATETRCPAAPPMRGGSGQPRRRVA
ncbi:hypothetical protein SALBM311S_05417 [Streptomyces alboniger]